MKSTLTQLAIFGILLLALVQPAVARGPAGVNNTLHNLSVTAPFNPFLGVAPYQSNEDEVCVFCHTPHGGSNSGPLWNHTNPSNAFTHYNSATLSTYMKGLPVNRAPSNESLICLSCHDGSISVYSMHNPTNDVGQPYNLNNFETEVGIAYLPGAGGNIGDGSVNPNAAGGNLADDHPISFSYDDVLLGSEYQAGGSKLNYLRTVPVAEAAGVLFYGATNRVECSTCHDPHVDYVTNTQYKPFLIMTNSGSQLCLACHNK